MTKPRAAAVSFAADIVLFATTATGPHVLVIQRGKPPYEGLWALPGGYVDQGETSEAAAYRELNEETGLIAPELTFTGLYDIPGRDPRGHVVSAAYGAVLRGTEPPRPVAADDARAAQWMPLWPLLTGAAEEQLAFDHLDIITDAAEQLLTLEDLYAPAINQAANSTFDRAVAVLTSTKIVREQGSNGVLLAGEAHRAAAALRDAGVIS